MNHDSISSRLVRFMIGLALVLGFAFCLGSGKTPPGMLGEVIRHNRQCNSDTTALFYSEVENMDELERGVADMRAAARDARVVAGLED